jgi:hypothetical protein
MKSWEELSGVERFLAERSATGQNVPPERRKTHRFCTRCWYEDEGTEPRIA